MNKQSHIIVIGGGYAGVVAALRLSRRLSNDPVTITLVDVKDHFVERIRLHQLSTGQAQPHLPYADLLAGTNINFVQGWVTGISTDQQSITLHQSMGDMILPYDYLVYALGSQIDLRSVKGVTEYAHSVTTEGSSKQLYLSLDNLTAMSKVVVCGGGLTGIETATEISESYPNLAVTLITQYRLGEDLSNRGREHLYKVFEKLGIHLIEHQRIEEITDGTIIYSEDKTLDFDVCIWSGAFTVPKLAQHSGLPVNHYGQVQVNSELQVLGYDNLYAIGDSATLEDALDMPIRMACATAVPMGGYVADQIANQIHGNNGENYRFRYYIRCISLGRKDALIQLVEPDDMPKEQVITGRLGVGVKEVICRATIWNIQRERWQASQSQSKNPTLAYEHAINPS